MRPGEPAITKLIDGVIEARDVLTGSVAGFWRKLGGISNYDGLRELIVRTYGALERQEVSPVPLEEIDETAKLVERFCKTELKL